MKEIGELKNFICDVLKNGKGFSNVRIVGEYSDEVWSGLEHKDTVVVGIEKLEAASSGFGNFFGSDKNTDREIFGNVLRVHAVFDIYCRGKGSAARCQNLAEKVFYEMMLGEYGMFNSTECGEIAFDKQISGFKLSVKGQADIAAELVKKAYGFRDIVVRRDEIE